LAAGPSPAFGRRGQREAADQFVGVDRGLAADVSWKRGGLGWRAVSCFVDVVVAAAGGSRYSYCRTIYDRGALDAAVQESAAAAARQASLLQPTDPESFQPALADGGSVAEWLACWTQAQKGPGSNRSRDAVR